MAFVHLHVHTQYSLLQGKILIPELMKKAVEYKMPAVAITDSHNLFGAIDFYLNAKKMGIHPVIGCEIRYAPQEWQEVQPNKNTLKFYQLVLLCKNWEGYQNLCQMLTHSYSAFPSVKGNETAPMRGIVNQNLLDRYGNGLIVLSGGLKGEIPYFIFHHEEKLALQTMRWFKKRFQENFFFEIQAHGLPEQARVNEMLFHYSKQEGIACVASVDCHYLNPEDAVTHEILQCIERGKNLDFDRPKSLVPREYYFKSEAVIREQLPEYLDACERTVEIAQQCQVNFQFKDAQGRAIYHLPQYQPDRFQEGENFDVNQYLLDQAEQGLNQRFEELRQKFHSDLKWPEQKILYQNRLKDELAMIIRTGFSGYFLIVSDFVNWAKNHQIPVGPGRGSGASSLVAYALRITDIDPIQFNLLFERFINPERISMADFDVDFCQDRRQEVIEYVSKKYGSQNVCQIITFGKLQARVVVKDVGRVLGMNFSETDKITKLFPEELNMTIDRALEMEPRLKEKIQDDQRVAEVIRCARELEGLYRNTGVHAAGVIITEKPVVHYCPLYAGRDGNLVSQFDKDFAEKIGLIKFDFLGLKTLTVIDYALKLIQLDASILSNMVHSEDPKVFELISSGNTDGMFQIESLGMKDLCMRVKPSSLEDLTAINALYRPGPLGSGMVDDFIERKHGRRSITYEVPALEWILKDTYGVILYQEQVMQIARELAGYSLGQADLLRRAMGKKKPEEMAKHREIFVQGGVQKGLNLQIAEHLFELIAKFAEYGFPKSHSAAYALLTYQTAYLKTYHLPEFMASLMSAEIDHTEKLSKYVSDVRRHHISILSPDVNASQKRFSVEEIASGKKAIRFGLEAIKGIGSIAVDAILEARKGGPFLNIFDFLKRTPTRKMNKRILEALCSAGAFDSISEINRASLYESVESLLEYAHQEQAEKELGQASLFDHFAQEELKPFTPISAIFKNVPDWSKSRKLAQEKEVVGFYLSGHPMDGWQKICELWCHWNSVKLQQLSQKALKQFQEKKVDSENQWNRKNRYPKGEIQFAGILSQFKEVTNRRGQRMGFIQIEDLYGKIEGILFADQYLKFQDQLKKAYQEAEILFIFGEVEWGGENPKVFVKSVKWLSEFLKDQSQILIIELILNQIDSGQLRTLKQKLLNLRGKCPICIHFQDDAFFTRLDLPRELNVKLQPQTIEEINEIFGQDVVRLVRRN